MPENPFFSIVIPLYNKKDLIRKTIESVLAQSFQDFEIVVVDDGSTDGSADVVNAMTDPRIRLISQPNAGVSAARNHGIREARADYIAFLDADDLWLTDYLQTQKEAISKFPDAGIFSTSYIIHRQDEDVDTLPIINKLKFSGCQILDNYFEVASCSYPPVWTSATVVNKNSILSVGGFPKDITSGEDLLTWARISATNKLVFTTSPHAVYNEGIGYALASAPGRPHDKEDVVGDCFICLLNENPSIPFLNHYVALWFKMRASVSLRIGNVKTCRKECLKSLKYHPTNLKVWAFLILSIFPSKLRSMLIRKLS